MKGSRKSSMTSQIVMLITVSIVFMQLAYFLKTGEILQIFNSLASMALGAYFQKSNVLSTDNKDGVGQGNTNKQ